MRASRHSRSHVDALANPACRRPAVEPFESPGAGGDSQLVELPLRVLIAGEGAFAAQTSVALERDGRFTTCARTADAAEAVEAAIATRPKIALIAVDLPGG